MKKRSIVCLMVAALICSSTAIPANNVQKETITAFAAVYDEVPNGYTGIYTIDDLYAIRNNLSGKYILMNDIDLSETAPGGDWDNGNGWLPIDSFTGTFDGNGYAVKNMHIYGEPDEQYIGLFGKCDYGPGGYETLISNLALIDVDINVQLNNSEKIYCVGSIAGYAPNISKCYVNGNITVNYTGDSNYDSHIGGIAGENFRFIRNCFNACNLEIYSNCKDGTHHNVGGISGYLNNGGINCCYNIGDIKLHFVDDDESTFYAGNIVGTGYNLLGTSDKLNTSYYFKINSLYSDFNYALATSYAEDSEFNNVVGLTKGQMKSQAAFTGFDFDKVWTIDPNAEYPYPTLIDVPYVSSQSPAVEPTQPTTQPSASTETKKGDMNGDGIIDAVDASLILSYYAYISTGGTITDFDMWLTTDEKIPSISGSITKQPALQGYDVYINVSGDYDYYYYNYYEKNMDGSSSLISSGRESNSSIKVSSFSGGVLSVYADITPYNNDGTSGKTINVSLNIKN